MVIEIALIWSSMLLEKALLVTKKLKFAANFSVTNLETKSETDFTFYITNFSLWLDIN